MRNQTSHAEGRAAAMLVILEEGSSHTTLTLQKPPDQELLVLPPASGGRARAVPAMSTIGLEVVINERAKDPMTRDS